MQLWQKQVIQLQTTPAVLGQTLNFQCQQDSYIGELLISLQGVIGTAAATANPEGLAALVSSVRVTGALNAGGNVNPINNIRGPQLNEMAQFIRANVSYSFGSLSSTGAFGVEIPCTFEHVRMAGFLRYMSVLPANAMGQLSIAVAIANQTGLDTNATPTFALTSLNVTVQQNQYFANTLDPKYVYYYTAMDQVQLTLVTAGTYQQQFPNGAAYLAILLRSMATTSATYRTCITKQADGGAGPIDTGISQQGKNLQLLDANNVPKEQLDYYELRKANLDQITDSLVPGNACFQFNRGITDIWRPIPGNNYIPLNLQLSTSGTTLPLIEFVYLRLFDPSNSLSLA